MRRTAPSEFTRVPSMSNRIARPLSFTSRPYSTSPKASSSALTAGQVLTEPRKHRVGGDSIRPVGFDAKPGVKTDLGNGGDRRSRRHRGRRGDAHYELPRPEENTDISVPRRGELVVRTYADYSRYNRSRRPVRWGISPEEDAPECILRLPLLRLQAGTAIRLASPRSDGGMA
jgi:hypothetical protein